MTYVVFHIPISHQFIDCTRIMLYLLSNCKLRMIGIESCFRLYVHITYISVYLICRTKSSFKQRHIENNVVYKIIAGTRCSTVITGSTFTSLLKAVIVIC